MCLNIKMNFYRKHLNFDQIECYHIKVLYLYTLRPFLAVQRTAKTSPLLLRGQEERTSLDVVDFHGKSQRHRPCFPSAVVCVPSGVGLCTHLSLPVPQGDKCDPSQAYRGGHSKGSHSLGAGSLGVRRDAYP